MKKLRIFLSLIQFLFAVCLLVSCDKQPGDFRMVCDLSGIWQFETDPGNVGTGQEWFLKDLPDSIVLPGTTDIARKGYLNTDTTTSHLNRVYKYEGPAWYRKTVIIPEDWQDHRIRLVMERTKPSRVWIDREDIGESFLLESPQIYDVSGFLTPGEHTISIRIDNDLTLTPYGNVHIYSDHTQTNWNGIIGDIYLEARDPAYISDLQVFPDIHERKVKIRISVENPVTPENVDVELHIAMEANGKSVQLESEQFTLPWKPVLELEYFLGDCMELWDEYQQPLYRLKVIVSQDQYKDSREVGFGMREFSTEGTQFTINGKITFLRGKNDACVFPLTGHSPMDSDAWKDVFNIAKSYGINHYRFHSWCPPNAAFEAADQVGIYLQPELPFWGSLTSDTIFARLREEGMALLKSYANHPSFVMFSPGNEIWTGLESVEKLITGFKAADGRPLYTQGSNNTIGYAEAADYTDFHLAARTPSTHDTVLTHTRLTHAFVDSDNGGILNTQLPSTTVNFDYPVSDLKIPLISHEIGQYQIYPDFSEIEKYTGVVRAWNMEVFRERLKTAGMLEQNIDFTKASGALSALCYRAEIEAALRTKGFAGFQLLDLQDFPGQGTALVGILDAFMDSKEVISRKEWTRFCSDVVPLLLFDRYCWTTDETFSTLIQVANYGPRDIAQNIRCTLMDLDSNLIMEEIMMDKIIPCGGLADIGRMDIPLYSLEVPAKLLITVSIDNTDYSNSYPIWVYPDPGEPAPIEDILIVSSLNNESIDALNSGRKVLLIPEKGSFPGNSVGGLFPPDFWNYGMFKKISLQFDKPVSPGTLGILTDPGHPLFREFPTDFHTNWQWWSIINNSNPLILDATEKGYKPIVQVIDNMERNFKLGLIFELMVGTGKLLVCMSELTDMPERPEACQLFRSILDYMESEHFNPEYVADTDLINQLFNLNVKSKTRINENK